MKITLIHGQNHKGSTYYVTSMLMEKLGGEVEEFFLPRDADKSCLGCYTCLDKGREFCAHYGQFGRILDSMLAADVIVIDSPTYVLGVTGQLKNLFDHLYTLWLPHRPEEAMFSKTAVAVSTAAGMGMKDVTKFIGKQMFYMGVPKTYRVSERVMARSWDAVPEKKKQQIDRNVSGIAKIIKNGNRKPKPGIKQKFLFNMMRGMQIKYNWAPLDKQHWIDKGWTGKARPWKTV